MPPGPTARRRQLARRLRELREGRGLTLEAAAELAGVSKSSINRYEKKDDKGAVKWAAVKALCADAYQADPDVTAELVELAKNARVEGWWEPFGSAAPDSVTPLLGFEAEAAELLYWAPGRTPGMLQTEEYATAVISAAEVRAEPAEIRQMVDVRMRRRAVLERPDPPLLCAILDEAVLRRRVGSNEVMAGQLAYLVECARRPHMTIQVLELASGAHAAGEPGFVYLRGSEPGLDLVHVPLVGSAALYLDKTAEVETYREAFDDLRSQALGPAESSEVMTKLGHAYEAAARRESR
ncbi:DUF5753 domain-containing protein [Actinacidiphila yeochonensis]|uniref:DUF5753 domain-containing protein n=1 Tax=Actinacidiphila yeochonensis TaxID=89050 RepID=UPI00068B9642|nr:DUF5753 domain-containing protein [Actinacidiphila yeochonensis]